jgi:hypothetical protein
MSKRYFSEDNNIVHQTIETNFAGKASVSQYRDEHQKNIIVIAAVENSPRKTIHSYATIGLSNHSIGVLIGGIPLGVEMVGACRQVFEKFPDMLVAISFDITQSKVRFHPGAVYKDVVSRYYPDFEMKHILFVPPYGWNQEFLTLELTSKRVGWLMALPISEAEWKFYKESESGELEELLAEKQVDIYDLGRRSIL